mmetsp:Transcript_4422/g.5650  ORF Transcript_4422/g.5650 Transcript_4422/m.5650 type:complete len:152 (+) Transcript_4422:18-473(+)
MKLKTKHVLAVRIPNRDNKQNYEHMCLKTITIIIEGCYPCLKIRKPTDPTKKYIILETSCVTNEPNDLPTITCHAPGYLKKENVDIIIKTVSFFFTKWSFFLIYLSSNANLTISATSFICTFSPFISDIYAVCTVFNENASISSPISLCSI